LIGESWGIELCGDGPTEIRKVRPGGPADHAGLQPGDVVLQCNGINTTRFGHQEFVLIIINNNYNRVFFFDSPSINISCKYFCAVVDKLLISCEINPVVQRKIFGRKKQF
jgi:hypothetical protein